MKRTDDNEIATELRTVISRLVKILRKETNNEKMLSLTERSTLALVYQHSEILPSELAAMEKVTAQSMSQIINKLFKAGYIKKTPSGKDGRKVIVTITAAGKKTVEKRRQERLEWLTKTIAEKTNKKEREILKDSIKVLTKLVDLK